MKALALFLPALSFLPLEDPPEPHNCFEQKVVSPDKEDVVVSQGEPITGDDERSKQNKEAIGASLAILKIIEESCVSQGGEEDEEPGTPVYDALKASLDAGEICIEKVDPPPGAASTSSNHKDIDTDDGVTVTNHNGINVNPKKVPKGKDAPDGATGHVILAGDSYYNLANLVEMAGILWHEECHRTDTRVDDAAPGEEPSICEQELLGYTCQVDFLCAVSKCTALMGDPVDPGWTKVWCQQIGFLNKTLCEEWELGPIQCEHCPEAEPCGDDGGDQDSIGVPYGVSFQEELPSQAYLGVVQLDHETSTISWKYSKASDWSQHEITCTWPSTPGTSASFVPTSFCLMSPRLAVVSGYSSVTGNGMLEFVYADLPAGVLDKALPILESSAFTRVYSMDCVPQTPAVVVLDSVAGEVSYVDLRTTGTVLLADTTDHPDIMTASNVFVTRHLSESTGGWDGLTVTVSDLGYWGAYSPNPVDASYFTYAITDTDGDGLIDQKIEVLP